MNKYKKVPRVMLLAHLYLLVIKNEKVVCVCSNTSNYFVALTIQIE